MTAEAWITEEVTPPPDQIQIVQEIPGEITTPERPGPRQSVGSIGPGVANRPPVTEEKEKPMRGRPPGSQTKTTKAKTTTKVNTSTVAPPDFSEWQDFIGSLVIRWVCRAFIAVSFRGGISDLVTQEELDSLELD